MNANHPTNPMLGKNRFKLGVFSANCDGGLTMSLAPERWKCDWDDIVAMCQLADAAGLEFILPVAKWRGYQGKANIYGKSFETMTHSAAIGALTKRICVFSTIHVLLITPSANRGCTPSGSTPASNGSIAPSLHAAPQPHRLPAPGKAIRPPHQPRRDQAPEARDAAGRKWLIQSELLTLAGTANLRNGGDAMA